MKRLLFFILVASLIADNCFAQQTDDEMYELANKYYKAKEYNKAVPILNELVKKNHAKALNILGNCYKNGYGVIKNMKKAVDCYQKCANMELPQAQFNLARCYYLGKGVAKDKTKGDLLKEKAFNSWSKLAEEGDTTALVMVGQFYYYGDTKYGENYEKAFSYFQKALSYGCAWAQYYLGQMYSHGDYVEADLNKAHDCLLQSSQSGFYDAQIALAWLFQDEEYLGLHERDYGDLSVTEEKFNSLTEKWLRVASKQNPDGLYELAYFYEWRRDKYNENRYPSPEATYKKAADAGSGKAQAIIGTKLLLEKKYDSARSMFIQAEDNGAYYSKSALSEAKSLEMLKFLCDFFKNHQEYSIVINPIGGNIMGDLCCWDINDFFYVYVKKRGEKTGFLKLSISGKAETLTPFNYELFEYASYDSEINAFRIDFERYIDLTGNEVEKKYTFE